MGDVLRRGWTFVRGAEIVTKTASPFLRRLLPSSAQLGDVITWLNLLVASIDEATRGSRSLPFGAGGTVVESMTFHNGVQAKIPHLLQTSNVMAIWGAATTGFVDASSVTFDESYCYVMPTTTWTGGVIFLVTP